MGRNREVKVCRNLFRHQTKCHLHLETLLTLTFYGILAHDAISANIKTDCDENIECSFFKATVDPQGCLPEKQAVKNILHPVYSLFLIKYLL